MAAILSQAMPTKTKASAATPTGTWAAGSGSIGYEADIIMFTTTSGDKLSYPSKSGDVMYCLYTGYEGQTGTFDVKLGASVKGSGSSNGGSSGDTSIKATSTTNNAYGPQAIRVAGFGAGSHTVDVVATNSGLTLIEGMISLADNVTMNTVLVMKLPHVSDYTTYFPAAGSTAAANARIDGYNTAIAAVVAVLAADGIPVYLCDGTSRINTATDIGADGLHPNNAGHVKLKLAFGAPQAPTIGTAVKTGSTTADVPFTVGSQGMSTITQTTVTSSPGGITGTVVQAGSGTVSMTGLSPNTSYTFTAVDTNTVGDSLASSASNSITTDAGGGNTVGSGFQMGRSRSRTRLAR